jgi:hypothetical protein
VIDEDGDDDGYVVLAGVMSVGEELRWVMRGGDGGEWCCG